MKKKVVPKLRQEVKVKVDIVTTDDIKIYYIGRFQDFTARYMIKSISQQLGIKMRLFSLLPDFQSEWNCIIRRNRKPSPCI